MIGSSPPRASERLLEFEAIEPRHLQIEQQTAGRFRFVSGEKLNRRGELGDFDPHGTQQARDGLTDRGIVIHHENGRIPFVHAHVSFANGRVQ